MLPCPGETHAWCPVPGDSRTGSVFSLWYQGNGQRASLFCTGLEPVSGAARRQGSFFSQDNSLGSFTRDAFPALPFGSPMRSRAGAGTAATARAAGLPQGQLSSGCRAARGRAGGAGSARGGCGGGGVREAPPAEHKG